ncbi:MAG: murein biosynthesis integral membrane protein MurJ [Candidatus Nealsonbacteria bacterium]|nr:murein biosynthesis integral membrane protein MurJ [Candidatus Nealsonbacteria bacterium]
MLNRVLNSQTNSITGAAILLGASAFGSQILGIIRDRLLAGTFGAGQELDVYFASFRIPDFVYAILITGGISAAFLPVFSEYFSKNKEEAWRLVNSVLNVFFILLILIAGFLALFTPSLLELITPGFSFSQKAITAELTRIIFLGSIIFGVSGIFAGILQYFNKFLAYALAPILYNLGIIIGIIFFVPVFGIKGLAYGVVFGSLLHFAIQLPAVFQSGYRPKPIFSLKNPGLIKIFKLMAPRTFGQISNHINLLAITAIGSTLTAGSISVFSLSNNLQSFPAGLVGVPYALAVFPSFSKAFARSDKQKFISDFSSTLRKVIFLIIPSIILIFLLRAQIVRLVLGTGQFGWADTRLTAASLGVFAFGIFAASLIPLLVRAFFSFQDTKTPVIIGMISIAINIISSLYFVWILSFSNSFQALIVNLLKLQGLNGISVIGLPLALSLSGTFQLLLLLFFLKRRIREIEFRGIAGSLKKILIASVLAGASAYFTIYLVAQFLNLQTFLGVFAQALSAFCIGAAVYGFVSYSLGLTEASLIYFSFLKKIKIM